MAIVYGHLWKSDDGKTLFTDATLDFTYLQSGAKSVTTGCMIRAGSSTTSLALNTAGIFGTAMYVSSTATSGTTYISYLKLTGNGAGAEFIASRAKVVLTAAAGNAHGAHHTLEVKAAGYVTGLGTAIRGNIVFTADEVVPRGTYYAVMGEIYAAGNTSALPASNACLCCSVPAGTAIDAVANAIAFVGTDGTGAMIDASSVTPTYVGSIRILVNGAVRYLYYGSNAT